MSPPDVLKDINDLKVFKEQINLATVYDFLPNQVIACIQITDCCGSRGKAAYTDVTHPLNPPPVRGTFVETRKEIRLWNTVSVKLYVIA